MKKEIISKIKKLQLKENDILVVQFEEHATESDVGILTDILRGIHVKQNVECLIMPNMYKIDMYPLAVVMSVYDGIKNLLQKTESIPVTGWFFVKDPILDHLPDGRQVVIQDIKGYRTLGFKRHGIWLSNFNIPIDHEVEQIYVLPIPLVKDKNEGEQQEKNICG